MPPFCFALGAMCTGETLRAALASRGRLAAHPAALAWRPGKPPNRRCLIGWFDRSCRAQRWAHLQPGVSAAHGGACRAAWVRHNPSHLLPQAGQPPYPAFIADHATVADGARLSRRAGPCPRLRLRAAPLPALDSLTARPRRPGDSRAMNSGKTVTNDGQGGQPRSLRRTHPSHTGLRILESGGSWKPQEGGGLELGGSGTACHPCAIADIPACPAHLPRPEQNGGQAHRQVANQAAGIAGPAGR